MLFCKVSTIEMIRKRILALYSYCQLLGASFLPTLGPLGRIIRSERLEGRNGRIMAPGYLPQRGFFWRGECLWGWVLRRLLKIVKELLIIATSFYT